MPDMTSVFRSLLFVPGARPDRFDKAASAGADTIIIDLEDAVLPDAKDEARHDALSWLASRSEGVSAGVRINSLRTGDGCRDLGALTASEARLDFVMAPKAETAADIEIVSEALGGATPVIAVIESGRAIASAHQIAGQAKGGVLFGGADYSASLGANLFDWDAMLTARGTIAAACGAAGVPAYDVPYLDVKDADGLKDATAKAKAFGFAGRACIHPSQVEAVNKIFSPTEAEIEDARAIIEALKNSGGGAVLHKGKLIDRPIIIAAEHTLARAGH